MNIFKNNLKELLSLGFTYMGSFSDSGDHFQIPHFKREMPFVFLVSYRFSSTKKKKNHQSLENF